MSHAWWGYGTHRTKFVLKVWTTRFLASKLVQLRNVKYIANKKSPNNAFYNGLFAVSVTILVASQPNMSVKTRT